MSENSLSVRQALMATEIYLPPGTDPAAGLSQCWEENVCFWPVHGVVLSVRKHLSLAFEIAETSCQHHFALSQSFQLLRLASMH